MNNDEAKALKYKYLLLAQMQELELLDEQSHEESSSKRLEILKNSLAKKEKELERKFDEHFKTVKQANGQPLNDKRNGRATLNKWERQNDSIRKLQQSIEQTKNAIEKEEGKVYHVEKTNENIPIEILAFIKTGELIQWRKYPNTFFVKGVDKARIVWDAKSKTVAYKFLSEIKVQEQRKKFAEIYNALYARLNNKK